LHLAWLVLRQGGTVAVVGLFAGVAAAISGARVIQGRLYRLIPTDPLIFGLAALVLFMTATVAMVFPVPGSVRGSR
jgi:hypothetical protein